VDYDDDGGTFALEIDGHGRWQINVPWIVAIEGWNAYTGYHTYDRDDLRKWLDDHVWRFSDMIVARVDPLRAAGGRDDPRVEAFRLSPMPALAGSPPSSILARRAFALPRFYVVSVLAILAMAVLLYAVVLRPSASAAAMM
jgi:hypothetical protein